jgi:hypothetical protein
MRSWLTQRALTTAWQAFMQRAQTSPLHGAGLLSTLHVLMFPAFPWLVSTHARSLGLGPNILQQTWSVLEAAHARRLDCESPRIWMMWVLVGRPWHSSGPVG